MLLSIMLGYAAAIPLSRELISASTNGIIATPSQWILEPPISSSESNTLTEESESLKATMWVDQSGNVHVRPLDTISSNRLQR